MMNSNTVELDVRTFRELNDLIIKNIVIATSTPRGYKNNQLENTVQEQWTRDSTQKYRPTNNKENCFQSERSNQFISSSVFILMLFTCEDIRIKMRVISKNKMVMYLFYYFLIKYRVLDRGFGNMKNMKKLKVELTIKNIACLIRRHNR